MIRPPMTSTFTVVRHGADLLGHAMVLVLPGTLELIALSTAVTWVSHDEEGDGVRRWEPSSTLVYLTLLTLAYALATICNVGMSHMGYLGWNIDGPRHAWRRLLPNTFLLVGAFAAITAGLIHAGVDMKYNMADVVVFIVFVITFIICDISTRKRRGPPPSETTNNQQQRRRSSLLEVASALVPSAMEEKGGVGVANILSTLYCILIMIGVLFIYPSLIIPAYMGAGVTPRLTQYRKNRLAPLSAEAERLVRARWADAFQEFGYT